METALHELTDNSFEHGARFIDICFETKRGHQLRRIQHVDDGKGIEDLQYVFCIGYERDRAAGGCGRYGIGMKKAIVVLGDCIGFKTVNDGVQKACKYDVIHLAREDEFLPTMEPENDTKEPSGTTIAIEEIYSPHQKFDMDVFERVVQSYVHRYCQVIQPNQAIRFCLNGDEKHVHVFTHDSVKDLVDLDGCPPTWKETGPHFELRRHTWLQKYYTLSASMSIDVWERTKEGEPSTDDAYVFTTTLKKKTTSQRRQFTLQKRARGNTTTLQKVTEEAPEDLESKYTLRGSIQFETFGAAPPLTRFHTVSEGDTIEQICEQYDISKRQLRDWNPGFKENLFPNKDEALELAVKRTDISSLTYMKGQGGLVYVFRNSHCITSIDGVRYRPTPTDGYSNRIVHHLSYNEPELDSLLGTGTDKQNMGKICSEQLDNILCFVSQAHEKPLRSREQPPKPDKTEPTQQQEAEVPPVVEQEAAVPPVVEQEAAVPPVVEQEAAVSPVVEQEAAVPPVVEQEAAVPPVIEPNTLESSTQQESAELSFTEAPLPPMMSASIAEPEAVVAAEVDSAFIEEPSATTEPLPMVESEPGLTLLAVEAVDPTDVPMPETTMVTPVALPDDPASTSCVSTGLENTSCGTFDTMDSIPSNTDDEYASPAEDVDEILPTEEYSLQHSTHTLPNVQDQRQQLEAVRNEHMATVAKLNELFNTKQDELRLIQETLEAAKRKLDEAQKELMAFTEKMSLAHVVE